MFDERPTVVITSNPLNHEGGVVAFYSQLLKHFEGKNYQLRHVPLGSRMEHFYSPFKKRLLYPIYYLHDLLSLTCLLMKDRRIRIVQVNPSLIPVPLIRDGLVVVLTRILRRKSVVMFHGWKEETVEKLRRSIPARWMFRQVFGRCDLAIVLASRFRDELQEIMASPRGVQVTTTTYDASEILPWPDRTGQPTRFVFLGRVSDLKGVSEILAAARLLVERGVDYQLLLIGHGDREGVVEMYQARVAEYGLENYCHFAGRLTGVDKFQALAESDVYVFPSWTEGCPTSVLEALGAGLFVISTDVGALRDVIHEGENGRIVRCRDPLHLADVMEWANGHIEEIRSRRPCIQQAAQQKYEVKVVCEQFQNIYNELSRD